jgi:hypothetical protein
MNIVVFNFSISPLLIFDIWQRRLMKLFLTERKFVDISRLGCN